MKKKTTVYTSPEVEMQSLQEIGILCESPSGFNAGLNDISGEDVTDASGSWNF